MKTAAIVYQFPSLTETFIANQLRGLGELGCDLTVFADGQDSLAGRHTGVPEVSYYGLPLKRVRDSIGKWKSAFPAHALPVQGGLRSPSVRYRLESRKLNLNGFDVVHAHFGPNGVRANEWRRQGIIDSPILTSFYGYDAGRAASRQGYRMLFEECELFLALSRHMQQALITIGCKPERIQLHPLGVDLDHFRPGAPKSRSHLEVISIARLVPKKGLHSAIDAIALLVKRGVSVRYTIIGEGLLRQSLEQRCRSLGIADVVCFTGPADSAVIVDRLSAADVLLAPSVTAADGDLEGTPMAILEAHACGIPVVATRHAGIPEIVPYDSLAEEEDSVRLADLIEELAESPSRRATMGNAGRAFVESNHDIRLLNRRLLDIYESLHRQ